MLDPTNHFPVFQPPWYLQNAMVQTLLASLKVRAWGKNTMLRHEKMAPVAFVKAESFSRPL